MPCSQVVALVGDAQEKRSAALVAVVVAVVGGRRGLVLTKLLGKFPTISH